MIRTRLKYLTSTKATLLEDRVNAEIEKLENAGYFVDDVSNNISFAGEKGYMILCTIIYSEIVKKEEEDEQTC